MDVAPAAADEDAILFHALLHPAVIRDVSTVRDAGDKLAEAGDTASETAAAVSGQEGGSDPAAGESIYKANCFACHGAGVAGAPRLGDSANWAPRIEQGMDVLHTHAIEGYQGESGYMPPKGGFTSLSDEQVKAAVQYMVEESR